MKRSLAWIAAAVLIGFVVPAVFSSALRWPREWLVVPYVVIVGGFLLAFFRGTPISWTQVVGERRRALLGAVIASGLLAASALAQPRSAVPAGRELVLALAWVGVVYGTLDGVFLSVMPVLAVRGPAARASSAGCRGRAARDLLALGASVAVTAAYHLGYHEFQGPGLVSPVIGNVVITATYLATGSPLAAVATHVALHVAAVLHGMETTPVLPPHYP